MPSPLPRRAVTVGAAAAAACALALTPIAANAAIVTSPVIFPADDAALALAPLGAYDTGVFDASGAEIVQAHGDRLFVVNAQAGAVSVLDYSDPAEPTFLYEIASDGIANSVAVRDDGLGVIAFEAPDKVSAGHVVFFRADAPNAKSAYQGEVAVGSLPDMVTFTDDGAFAVVANEGEPADDFSSDPEGSISVVALPATLPLTRAALNRGLVVAQTADFHEFEAGGGKTLDDSVRVFGPTPESDLPVSRNLEPEYIATDGHTAYVTLQEANAIAVVDLDAAEVDDIFALGLKDYGVAGNGIDASNEDGAIDIRTWQGVYGMYMPDSIASYTVDGTTYLVTANEGDAREWGDYVDAVRVKDLAEDGYGPVCPSLIAANGVDITAKSALGRLNVSKEDGFDEELGCYDALVSYGARSFSIWTTDGEQVFDSADAFEQITAAAVAADFNSTNDENGTFDNRSDDKGPEPEGIAVGEVDGRIYAFVGLERVGGVMVYDITDPAAAEFVTYVNNRDFTVDAEVDGATNPLAGDLGPEGLAFIPASASPNGAPLVAVGNEVSGTTTLFEITPAG